MPIGSVPLPERKQCWPSSPTLFAAVGGDELRNKGRPTSPLWHQQVHIAQAWQSRGFFYRLHWNTPSFCLPFQSVKVLYLRAWKSSPYEREGCVQSCGTRLVAVEYIESLLWAEPYLYMRRLTHWGQVTHICVGNLTIIASDNGWSPGRRRAIIWTDAGILLIRPLGTNFNKMLIKILTFSFMKMRLKVMFWKWRPLCLGLNVF